MLEQPPAQPAPPDPPGATTLEGTYLPANESAGGSGWRRTGAVAAAFGLMLAKGKGLLIVLLNLKWFLVGAKVLASAFTFLASVWFYALFFGWPFALVFTLLILVHESGHLVAMRALGVPASLPYFIPGFGALVAMKGRPASVLHEAYIALAGPLAGAAAALACFLYGEAAGSPFWVALSYTGFLLNLFNLLPVPPLDGGRIAGAISPRIWVGGLVALVGGAIWLHWFNPLLFVLVLVGIPQIIAAFRGELDKHYFALGMGERATIAVLYFGLAALLVAGMLASHVNVPARSAG